MVGRVTNWDWLLTRAAGEVGQGRIDEAALPQRESERQEALLAIADIEFRLYGGGKCAVCRAPVRAVMKTVAVDDAGRRFEYDCLCRRCLEAERAYSRAVTSYIGGYVFDDFLNRKPLVERPAAGRETAAA